jgi:hypothetical protein
VAVGSYAWLMDRRPVDVLDVIRLGRWSRVRDQAVREHDVIPLTREEFVASVDWPTVRADLANACTDIDLSIAQVDAEVRAGIRRRDVRTQEELAARQANIDAIDDLAALIG